ncbi:nucleotidyltransferase family protein [uncultured Fibrella sp.]|uniref:nucleotidyltransferase family protein n=1 Tax=uncultured Fibrella sp. TaxID=1284596 RepID=UPI0035C94CD9
MKEALNQIGEPMPFKTVLTDYFRTKPVIRAYLFGSYVRGEQSETSDVDILVELDYEQGADFFGFIQMQDELAILLKKPVDLLSANGLSTFIKPYIDAEKQLIYATINMG